MCLFRRSIIVTIAIVMVLDLSQATAEEEITIGRSAAGQLKVDIDFAQPLELPVSAFSGFGIYGYATGEVGLHSAAQDEPTNDFFQLSTAGYFRFILLAKDPGM